MHVSPRLAVGDAGAYEVRWRDGGVSKRRSLRTKDAAEAHQRFAAFLLGAVPQPAYTIDQVWMLRSSECLDDVADPQRIRDCWKRLLGYFGSRDVATLKPQDFSAYTTWRETAGQCAASTARRELIELRAALNHMVTTRRMAPTALPYIALPPTGSPRPHFLSLEDIERVRAALRLRRVDGVPTRLELFIEIGLCTGARRRAIEHLEWDQVCFRTGMIHFAKLDERVTRKRKVSIPMRQTLRAILEIESFRKDTDWVLIAPASIRTAFTNVMFELGLTHVTPHTLRHTFISHLLIKGVPVFTVSKLAGVSVREIERTYGHLSAAHLQEAIEI